MLAKTKNKQGLTLTVWEAVPVTLHGARLAPGGNRFAFLFFSQNPGRRPRTRLSEPPDAARQPQEKRIQPNSQPPGSPQPETVARGSGLCWQGTLPRSLCWGRRELLSVTRDSCRANGGDQESGSTESQGHEAVKPQRSFLQQSDTLILTLGFF